MFKYFPTNYPWNLAVDLAIEMGAKIGEIEEMCAPILEASKQPDDAGARAFRDSWAKMGDKLCALAEEDEAKGRLISAGDKYGRAATYFLTCERLQAHGAPGRLELYRRCSKSSRAAQSSRAKIAREWKSRTRVGASGVVRARRGRQGRAPVLVQVNGLDSTKEMKYFVGLPRWLAKRGVASLVVDQPGTGEALRLHGMNAVYNSEVWATKIVDWLETSRRRRHQADRPRRRFTGGYYCPRAVAFEPRFACGVACGANHDWRDVQKKRLAREGSFPVPHYWEHVRWVWGAKDMEEFMAIAEKVHLDGILDRIRVPFLVTHGEADSQIPLQWAYRTYEQLINSPKRELKIFTDREAVSSIRARQFRQRRSLCRRVVAETLGGRTSIRT